jgi:hypothetical protein
VKKSVVTLSFLQNVDVFLLRYKSDAERYGASTIVIRIFFFQMDGEARLSVSRFLSFTRKLTLGIVAFWDLKFGKWFPAKPLHTP